MYDDINNFRVRFSAMRNNLTIFSWTKTWSKQNIHYVHCEHINTVGVSVVCELRCNHSSAICPMLLFGYTFQMCVRVRLALYGFGAICTVLVIAHILEEIANAYHTAVLRTLAIVLVLCLIGLCSIGGVVYVSLASCICFMLIILLPSRKKTTVLLHMWKQLELFKKEKCLHSKLCTTSFK